MYTYFAYNLHIRSNIPFPELVSSRREDVRAEPDVNICICSIAPAESRFANTYQQDSLERKASLCCLLRK